MSNHKSKYSAEIRAETAQYIIDHGLTATGWAREHGIDKNIVCRWVRDFKRTYKTVNYRKNQRFTEKMESLPECELVHQVLELKKKLKQMEMDLEGEQEKIEILKSAVKLMRLPDVARIEE